MLNHNLRSFIKEIYGTVRPNCSISPAQQKEHREEVENQCREIEQGISVVQPTQQVLQLIDIAYKELTSEEIAQLAIGCFKEDYCQLDEKYAPLDEWANNFFCTFIG